VSAPAAPAPADIRLVALDLDGTVCLPGGALGPRAARAIRALAARGVHVVFSTGRSARSTARLNAELGMAHPQISLNGSVVTDGRGALWHHAPLPGQLAADVRAKLRDFGLVVVPVLEDLAFHPHDSPWTAERLAIWELRETVARGEDDYPAGATMMFAIGEADAAQAAAAALRARYGAALALFAYQSMSSGHFHVEVRAGGDDKGSGLRVVRERLGLAREATLAVGDWLNDLSLLEEAGYRVAMRHAPAALRELAHAVTRATNHTEGAADFLEAFFDLDGGADHDVGSRG
jgi:hypothetical protein